jgi:hypothetical protein
MSVGDRRILGFLPDGDPASIVGEIWADGVASISAVTSAGNSLGFYAAEDGRIKIIYWGARWALRTPGNVAGSLFADVFCRRQVLTDGSWEYVLDIETLQSLDVIEYTSARTDAPWWECGLRAPRVPTPKFSSRRELRGFLASAPRGQESLYLSTAQDWAEDRPDVLWDLFAGDIQWSIFG